MYKVHSFVLSFSFLGADVCSFVGVDAKQDLATLCENQKVADLVLKECNAVGKKNNFKSMEMLQSVILAPEEWTPESGLVTAASKLVRGAIAKKYSPEIKQAYSGKK